ncbi:MAG: glycosyltransferase family 4 protein [Ruminococcaceae bacterium]|nr:glycosyltransferase family 4 protein [Oscillospiraceae bacterium]
MGESMKILFVISCLSYGGAEKNLMLVANHFNEIGHSVAICNFNERETMQQVNENIKYYENTEVYEKKGKFAWVGLRKMQYDFLKSTCKDFKPDVIISFLGIPNFLSVICGKSLKTPVIISERADPYRSTSKLDKIMHFMFNKADGAVFQSYGAQEFYSEKLQKKSKVIPNPVLNVNTDYMYDAKNADKTIAFAGRFETAQKRQDIMIKSMKKVLDKYPDYKLIFYGDGQNEEDIKNLAKETGIDKNVVFAGVSDNLTRDISKSEIYVLTSDYEGIPNTLIEAMTIGMPCVSTDCSPGGARMLIDSGVNGTLVPCGDVDAIAKAIIYYIENKDIAAEHGKKAISLKDKYCYDVIMKKWEEYVLKFKKN